MRFRITVIAIVVTFATLSLMAFGCASAPPKQTAVLSTQAIHAALSAAQDAEMALCAPAQAALSHCLAVPTVLTDAQHQAIESALGRAFDAEIKLAIALKAWQPGAAMPASAPDLQREVAAALAAVRAASPTGRVGRVIDQILAAQVVIADMATKLGGKR